LDSLSLRNALNQILIKDRGLIVIIFDKNTYDRREINSW
jgi:hypothetical protein